MALDKLKKWFGSALFVGGLLAAIQGCGLIGGDTAEKEDRLCTPGANVYGSDGTLAGTIESIDESLVKIKLANGQSVRLPRNGVSGSDKGAVLGVTTAKLNELASQAAGPDTAAPNDTATSEPKTAAEPQAPSGK